MRILNKVVLGVALFMTSLVCFAVLSPETTSAVTATSEEQIKELLQSLEKTDESTIKGTLNNNEITFKQIGLGSNSGFVAENLECDGSRAVLTTTTLTGFTLKAKYRSEGRCIDYESPGISFGADGKVAGVAGGDVATDDILDNSQNCESSDSGPLGWILCPIIDAAGKFTTYAFENFVQPFLEDVPVTSNPDDPSYKAWNTFRIIGNIVLVGTMLAVVYAQVKGDK